MAARQAPCIMCHRSTNRVGSKTRKSYLLDYDFISQNSFLPEYIQHEDESKQISEGSRICRPCFQRAQYWRRQTNLQKNDDSDSGDVEPDHTQDDQEIKIEENQSDARVRHVKIQTDEADDMEIPGYTRVPNSTRNCIYIGCNSPDLHIIHIAIRADILLNKNIYIPHGVRVCDEHIVNSAWSEIETSTRDRVKYFKTAHIIDMLELQKRGSVVYL